MPKIAFLLLIPLLLQAQFDALLHTIDNNHFFHFSYKEIAFNCKAATVVTLGMQLENNTTSTQCRQSIQTFFKKYPKIPLAYQYVLHEDMTYTIKPYGKECFVMLNGATSWSEYLLEEGFAVLSNVIELNFLNSAGYERLKLAQDRAKYHKRGLWSDIMVKNCIK